MGGVVFRLWLVGFRLNVIGLILVFGYFLVCWVVVMGLFVLFDYGWICCWDFILCFVWLIALDSALYVVGALVCFGLV